MPQLKDLGRRFKDRLRTSAGSHFFGQISLASTAEGRVGSFNAPRRILTCHPNTLVFPGDLIYDKDNNVFLVGEDGSSSTMNTTFLRHFKLFYLDRQLTWTRTSTVVDLVTGLPKNDDVTDLGTIWGTLELLARAEDLSVEFSRYRMLTNAALQHGDHLDGSLTVRRVEQQLGITIAEVA